MDQSSEPEIFGSIVNDARVRELVSAHISGTASPDQIAEVSDLIATHPAVCDFYISHAALISQLTVYATAPSAKEFDEAAPAGEFLPADAIHLDILTRPFLPRATGIFLAIALGVTATCWGALHWGLRPFPQSPEVVGQLHWNSDHRGWPLAVGQRVAFEEGDCKITLVNGVELQVSSPALLEIEDPMRCRMWQGRLTADVPDQAIGFRVLTKNADIVDQGTRFGVAVEPDGVTDIAVFEGVVDLASHQQPLKVGRGVTIDAQGNLSRLQMVTPDTFESPSQCTTLAQPTITSVRDNIRSTQELGFYRIVPGGFGEDEQAYVDRVHQWNSLGTNGLPEELLGGDYVMPFNDDKLTEDFEITLTLARKANLYVLFDDRNEVPEWLGRDFIDSGIDVGQDEGHVSCNKTYLKTDVGGGQSIDTGFSVWKSRAPRVGEVTLQGLWNGLSNSVASEGTSLKNMRSMYGILAVPVITD